MPRKPAEKYYQERGAPHKGLRDPAAYGLTYVEVLKLIEEGRWDAFVKRRKREEKLREKLIDINFICPSCMKRKTDLKDWYYHAKECRECRNKRVRADAGKRLTREQRLKGSYATSTKRCYYCKRHRSTMNKKLLGRPICEKCVQTFQEMQNEIHSRRSTE